MRLDTWQTQSESTGVMRTSQRSFDACDSDLYKVVDVPVPSFLKRSVCRWHTATLDVGITSAVIGCDPSVA